MRFSTLLLTLLPLTSYQFIQAERIPSAVWVTPRWLLWMSSCIGWLYSSIKTTGCSFSRSSLRGWRGSLCLSALPSHTSQMSGTKICTCRHVSPNIQFSCFMKRVPPASAAMHVCTFPLQGACCNLNVLSPHDWQQHGFPIFCRFQFCIRTTTPHASCFCNVRNSFWARACCTCTS